MEQPDTLNPAAEATDAPPAAPEESASQAAPAGVSDNAFMNAVIRGGVATLETASKPDADEFGDDGADSTGGESAPVAQAAGDVKPPEKPPTGRRAAAAEIERLNAEVARLTQAVEAANPPPPDATEENRKAILERETRFRTLVMKPDTDADWNQDDYNWLQEEKQRRAIAPELRQHYDTVIEADKAALRQQHEAERVEFWERVGQDMASGAELPGVDIAALKAAPNFAARDRLIYAAATAIRDAEVKGLRDQIGDLQRQLFGTVRPPLNGGRSGGPATFDEKTFMNAIIRRGSGVPA